MVIGRLQTKKRTSRTGDPVQKSTGAAQGSAARALLVLGLVMERGAVSAAEITEATGLSRSAVHRAIHVLIDQGFVRYQLGKLKVVLSNKRRMDVAPVGAGVPALERVAICLETALRGTRMQCDIAVLSTGAQSRIVESTDIARSGTQESYFDSDLISVALVLFAPVDVARITQEALRLDDSVSTVDNAFLGRYRLAGYQGYLWDPDFREFCFPVRRDGDHALVVRLWSRESSQHSLRAYKDFWGQFRKTNPNLFEGV